MSKYRRGGSGTRYRSWQPCPNGDEIFARVLYLTHPLRPRYKRRKGRRYRRSQVRPRVRPRPRSAREDVDSASASGSGPPQRSVYPSSAADSHNRRTARGNVLRGAVLGWVRFLSSCVLFCNFPTKGFYFVVKRLLFRTCRAIIPYGKGFYFVIVGLGMYTTPQRSKALHPSTRPMGW